jgi:hypothetical protein
MADKVFVVLLVVVLCSLPLAIAQFVIGLRHFNAKTRCFDGVLVYLIGSGVSEFISIVSFLLAAYILKVSQQYKVTTEISTTTYGDGRQEKKITKTSQKNIVLGKFSVYRIFSSCAAVDSPLFSLYKDFVFHIFSYINLSERVRLKLIYLYIYNYMFYKVSVDVSATVKYVDR